ncbi:YitT family protein [Candidatus Stoquefichus massiliensis]|uniref:YitT family protein n=1 Tax=Candidatus Stoquefichus massiliensis TaxID=1470350 RepID=UPI0004881B34|nr:YitT family protein [Candidatus Stoquefichus massiliensis]
MSYKTIKNIIGIILGNTLYALAVILFIVPNGLITGGSTGLAIAANHVFGMSITAFVSIFNIVMFGIGFWILGKTFALTTLISTFYFPFILSVFEKTMGYTQMTTDPLLAALLGGVLIGSAIGIVIKCNASTGGMDIPPLVINKKIGIPVSISMYIFDFMILLMQVFYTDKEMVLYGIVLVATYTIVLDKVLVVGKAQTEVMIVSKEYNKINEAIIHDLDRGTTMLKSISGYMKNEYPVVMTVVSNRELPKLNDLVLNIDEHAFMVVSKVNEVRGRGFTFKKEYIES